MRYIIVMAFAAAALAESAFAQDPISSSAQMSISITLTDLNPLDGIAPSITFAQGVNGAGRLTVRATNDGWASGPPPTVYDSSTPFAPLSGSVDSGQAHVSASITGAGPYVLSVSGSARSGPSSGYGGTVSLNDAGNGLSFTLSPYTTATFTGVASVTADTAVNTGPINQAYASAEIYTHNADFSRESIADVVVVANSHGAPLVGFNPPHAAANDDVIRVHLDNDAGTASQGFFRAGVTASGDFAAIGGVPEPATWASMLAGLVLMVGWGASRSSTGKLLARSMAIRRLLRRWGV